MRRRDFLSGAAALAGAMVARPARASSVLGTPSGASPWGDLGGREVPGAVGKVLEVFLYGGISPFESFYVVEDHGRPNDPTYPSQQWWLFADQHEAIFSGCGLADPGDWLLPFASASDGALVSLGPVVAPLRRRPDLLDRMRVVVTRHDLEPHEAAIPLALSGSRLGNPRMAGLGAHVQRHATERDGPRAAPYSWVFTPDTELNTDNLRAASAVGQHPGSARPLSLKIDGRSELASLLGRQHLSDPERARVDALLAHYTGRLDDRYTVGGSRLRSHALDDHTFALSGLASAPELAALFGDGLLASVGGSSCGAEEPLYHTAVGLRAAVELLNHPTAGARYVNVIDAGLQLADGGGGYDGHFEHLLTQTTNGLALFEQLASKINEPGESDPAKLDLDEAMIVLTTEFGRTPFQQDRQIPGTNHHPYGYVNVLIGGPIRGQNAGVVGAIGPDGVASEWVTPSELRAALMLASGVWPFAPEGFAVSDVRGVATEAAAADRLLSYVLGVSS